MNDLLAEMASDSKQLSASDAQLALVSRLAQSYRSLKKVMDDAEATFVQAKKDFEQVQKKELPEALKAVGIKTVLTNDNLKVETDYEIHAAISKPNSEAAFAWLRENKFGGLIKNKIEMLFPRGEDVQALAIESEIAGAVAEIAKKHNIDLSRKEEVHHSTLKAWVKEQREKGGLTSPEEVKLFGIFVEQVSTVK